MLLRSFHTSESGCDTHVIATASVEAKIERGIKAVRRLDAIVHNKFRDDPATLAAWEHARHVERAARTQKRTKGKTEAPPSGERQKG